MRKKQYYWTDLSKEQQDFLIQNYSNTEISPSVFESVLKMPIKNIQSLATRQKLKRRVFYKVNEDYFDDINTEVKAYFLGFLYADGNNYKPKFRIQMNIQEQDISILEVFAKEIGYCGKLYFGKGRMAEGYKQLSKPQVTFRFISKKISDVLESYGMTPNKTMTLKFPTCVPDHLMNHFIRGVFDGDGCIYIKEGTTQCSFNICGTKDMVDNIKNILQESCDLTERKIREGKNLFLLDWGGIHQLRRIREYLYKDATVYLERKYNKFKQLN